MREPDPTLPRHGHDLLPSVNRAPTCKHSNKRLFSAKSSRTSGGEGSKKIQLRADFYNAFNHPQYVPGSVNGVEPITTTGVSQINTVGGSDFNVPSHVFSSHPRVIQFALRFDF